jgi:hypothetical protein
MKHSKFFLFILPLFFSFLFYGCSDTPSEEPPTLTVKEKKVTFEAGKTQRSISIVTNMDSWTFAVQPEAADWLSAIKSGNRLVIVVKENTEMDSRSGTIIIRADNLTETVTVEQIGQAPAIIVSSEIFTVEAEGGEIDLEITSNIKYEIVIPADVDWIHQVESPTRGMVTHTFKFKVDWNAGEQERQAEILIKQINGDLQKQVLVIQKGQTGYTGGDTDDIKDDIKVPVSSGKASSYQSGANIEKSFDGDFNTLYHSNWNNSAPDYFPITLDYFFENQECIDYLIYYPRTEGYNGRFKEVEIWVKTEENPTYVKVTDYDFKGSSIPTRVVFEKPVEKPLAIRFVIKSGVGDGQGFASCAEMEFYRRNPDNFDVLTIFSDITCSELRPGITLTDIEKIPVSLYRNIALYLYNGNYPAEFRIQEYRAWPHPDDWAKENKTSTLSLLDNPTGISVSQGEDLVVFVGKTNGHTLSIKVQDLNKPNGDGYGNASFYSLAEGMNKLKMKNKGLVYVFYHTPDYKVAPPVKIHFATGQVNGYYDSQKHQPSDWARLLNAAKDPYFDVLGEYAHLTFPTEDFRTYAGNDGPELIAAYDDLVRLEEDFMGLMKYDRHPVNRAYFHVMYTSYMYSTSYRTAYNVSTTSSILKLSTLKSTPWGPAHELGHTFQTRPGFKWLGMTEVSNNVHSLYVQTQWGNPSRLESESMGRFNNRYEKAYYNSFVNGIPHPGEADVFCKLVSLWQLQLYLADACGYTDFYKDFYEQIRIKPDKPTAGEQQLEFVITVCDVAKKDLTDFFVKWGYLTPFDAEIDDYGKGRLTVTQHQIDEIVADIKSKNYPPVTDKIEYICDSNKQYFKNRSSVQKGTATKNGTSVSMLGWKNVVAYEVYEGDKLVFVSNKDSFTLDSPVTSSTKVYAVAYNGDKTEVSF